jgi:hypothetical protein
MNLLFPLNANIPVSPRAKLLACQDRMWFMLSIRQYLVVWSGIIINERWTGKDMGGSGHGTIDVIFRSIPGATEEQYKILNQDSRCSGSESTQAHRTEVQLAPWISKIWFFSQKRVTLFWIMTSNYVSEEYSASIFRAGAGRSTFLRSSSSYLLVYMTSHHRKP